jgi:hypothetical protein
VTELQRLTRAIDEGTLVLPGVSPTFVDLTHALIGLCGGPPVSAGPGAADLARILGQNDHYILVLVDGMGARLVEQSASSGFFRDHSVATLTSVYPSATTAALTTLSTGVWPGEHATPGWWLYLPEMNRSIVTLPFTDRLNDVSLATQGITADNVLPIRSIWPDIPRQLCSVVPSDIAGTIYSNYASGGTPRIGYRNLEEAMRITATQAMKASRPSFTYCYLPQLDTLMHEKGTLHGDTRRLLAHIETQIAGLCGTVAGHARVLVTADHGHVDIPPALRHCLSVADPLVQMLVALPSGEPRTPFFHVPPGHEEEFRKGFLSRFASDYVLLTPDQLEGLRLLGPGPLTRRTRERLGTFVAVPLRNATLHVHATSNLPEHAGAHGGLLPEEMLVPLIVG